MNGAAAEDTRALAGRTPVPGDAQAGVNIRYEPEFLSLQEEVARQDTEGPLAVNWRRVVAEGCELLATRSKDLLICTYVVLGLARTEGFRGLAIGLTVTADLVDLYWADMEPPAKRERARVQMLEWIVARVVPLILDTPPDAADGPAVIAAFRAIDRLDSLLETRLVKETVALGELSRVLRGYARDATPPPTPPAPVAAPAEPVASPAPVPPVSAPAPAIAAQPVPPAPPPPAPAASPAPPPMAAPPPVAAPASSADVEVALGRMQQSLLDVARGVQAANNADPRGYTLLRQGIWCTVLRPPMNTAGVTPLSAPAPDRLAQFAAQQAAGLHAEALGAIEQTLASSPFWLNGHRLACLSLEALGKMHDAARIAIIASLAALLRRIPELLELSFSNRSPFADDATRSWIAEAVMLTAAGAAGDNAIVEEPEQIGERDARRLAASGKLSEALTLLSAGSSAASSGRARFGWQLAQAALCLDNGQAVMAQALLTYLHARSLEFALEQWEPALTVRLSELSYFCTLHPSVRSLLSDEARASILKEHLERLCRLDMSAAATVLKLQ